MVVTTHHSRERIRWFIGTSYVNKKVGRCYSGSYSLFFFLISNLGEPDEAQPVNTCFLSCKICYRFTRWFPRFERSFLVRKIVPLVGNLLLFFLGLRFQNFSSKRNWHFKKLEFLTTNSRESLVSESLLLWIIIIKSLH